MSVPYGNVVQERTIPLGTRALNIYCKGVGRFPEGVLIISIIRPRKEIRFITLSRIADSRLQNIENQANNYQCKREQV